MIFAYSHGSSLFRYIAHYLIARGLFQALDRFGWPLIVAVGVLILGVLFIARRLRRPSQSLRSGRYDR